MGKGCDTEDIKKFFSVESTTVAANAVSYLYNGQQSTSQVSGDLLTTTFPGFQAVLTATATAGSSQPAATSSAGGTSTQTTDSVSTTVAKIESGGDFNLRFPIPVLYGAWVHSTLDGKLAPNVGFDINGFGAQSTITESSQYSLNVPVDIWYQTVSIDENSPAVFFVNARPSVEVISADEATHIGLQSSRGFFLGQAAAGIEFANSIRISFQYFYGPRQVYTTPPSSPGGTSTTINQRIQGLHLVVSFSPRKSS